MGVHGYMGNHGPVDEGAHRATSLAIRIDEALAGQDDQVALADIADLQRYSLATIGVIDGVDHGAEMEEDDEGEYVLLADVLRIKGQLTCVNKM